ncbi:MAG: hypothetical protein AVDCRST_MAG07-2324, partial [uncultured Frankineae bacterium]
EPERARPALVPRVRRRAGLRDATVRGRPRSRLPRPVLPRLRLRAGRGCAGRRRAGRRGARRGL